MAETNKGGGNRRFPYKIDINPHQYSWYKYKQPINALNILSVLWESRI